MTDLYIDFSGALSGAPFFLSPVCNIGRDALAPGSTLALRLDNFACASLRGTASRVALQWWDPTPGAEHCDLDTFFLRVLANGVCVASAPSMQRAHQVFFDLPADSSVEVHVLSETGHAPPFHLPIQFVVRPETIANTPPGVPPFLVYSLFHRGQYVTQGLTRAAHGVLELHASRLNLPITELQVTLSAGGDRSDGELFAHTLGVPFEDPS